MPSICYPVVRAHLPLDGLNGAGSALVTACRLAIRAHDALAVFRKGYHRRSRASALRVGDDHGFAALASTATQELVVPRSIPISLLIGEKTPFLKVLYLS